MTDLPSCWNFLASLPIVVVLQTEMPVAPELRAQAAISSVATIVPATEQDWYEEYLAPVISIKVVEGVDEAIAHINQYSSHHTDAILTRDHGHAQRFLREVDSASCMVNASTRFADGFEYGLGAEIGISTDKFHARGPVGIEGLTSLKYVVLGDGDGAPGAAGTGAAGHGRDEHRVRAGGLSLRQTL